MAQNWRCSKQIQLEAFDYTVPSPSHFTGNGGETDGDSGTPNPSHRCKHAGHPLSQGNLTFTSLSLRTKTTRRWKLPLQVAPVLKHPWPSRCVLTSIPPSPCSNHSQCNHPVPSAQTHTCSYSSSTPSLSLPYNCTALGHFCHCEQQFLTSALHWQDLKPVRAYFGWTPDLQLFLDLAVTAISLINQVPTSHWFYFCLPGHAAAIVSYRISDKQSLHRMRIPNNNVVQRNTGLAREQGPWEGKGQDTAGRGINREGFYRLSTGRPTTWEILAKRNAELNKIVLRGNKQERNRI